MPTREVLWSSYLSSIGLFLVMFSLTIGQQVMHFIYNLLVSGQKQLNIFQQQIILKLLPTENYTHQRHSMTRGKKGFAALGLHMEKYQ